jgi:PAS domain S-box-containing protein
MDPPLRVLHLEDEVRDTELVQASLEEEGIRNELTRVQAEQDFISALKDGRFDLILADYTLPAFDGLAALKLAREHAPDVPFLFVSGTLGEDVAIEALKKGATDYVLKTRLARLGPSITRALREGRERTQRKRAEEALRDSEEQWKAAFESNPVMYFMVDGTGTTLSVNAFGANQLGYKRSDLVGQSVLNVFYEADRKQVRQHLENCFQNLGRTFKWEARKVRKDGTVIWVRETANALLLKNRPVLLVVCEDITDRKRAEESARRSEKQLRDVFETIPAMAWSALPDGRVDFMNRAWQDYTGLSMDKALGPKSADIIHPDDQATTIAEWESALKNGQPLETEVRLRRADGEYRSWFVRNVPLRDEHANIVKWYGTAIDIEDRKRAEALLAGEKRILEMVTKGDPVSEVLDGLCCLVEKQASGVLASILLLEGDRLRHGSAPSLPKAYTDAIDGFGIGPYAGSYGTAAYTGKQVIVEDIATDPLWTDYRDLALPHGLRACWSTPIFSSRGNVIATFAMYYHEPRNPTQRDQQIIDQITHLAGIAIERKLTQHKLALSERNLAEAQRLTHTGSFVWDVKTEKAMYLSEEWYRIFAFEAGHEGAWEERLKRIHPKDRTRWQTAVDRAIKEKSDYELEKRLVLPDGVTKYLHALGHPVLNSCGDVVQFVGTVSDITEAKRAEALLRGEKQLLEMIATGVPLKRILNALCEIIEEQRPGTLASVLLMDPDGIHLNVVAGPKLPGDWTRQMEKMPIGPCAGSCGTAAYRGSPVIVSDIATDPLWNAPEHRASALKHGLQASWSKPVLSWQGKVLATFCMYYREPRSPTSQDLELIELASHLARVAIERDRAEEALRTSEQLARSHVEVMMRSLDVLATEAAPEKFTAEMLRTIGQRLHARTVLLWLRDPEDDSLHLRLVIEDGRQVAPHQDHPFVKDPHLWKRNLPFQEMLFTKGPVVCDNVEQDHRIGAELREYLMKRGRRRFLAIPMFVLGEVRGFIGIQHVEGGAYRPEEIELAQALAHHVMIAAHGAELSEQRRHAVVLQERTRMARDIHDTLAQGFTGVIVQLDTAVEALRDEEPEAAAKHIRQARELARDSLTEARRSVHALRPQALEKAAFADALKAIITNTTAGTSLRADFQLKGEPRELRSAVEENLFQIGKEALSNALKHACATEFHARLSFDSEAVRLELRDNGKGFVADSANRGGIGLIGMKERAEQIGATLAVTSEPHAGTTITAVSPYQEQVAT